MAVWCRESTATAVRTRWANRAVGMNPRNLKFIFASIVWVLGFLFAARIVAQLLCGSTRSYTDQAGVYVTEVTVAEPEIVWKLILSPVFAIPAMVFLFLGWIFIWRVFADRPTTDSC